MRSHLRPLSSRRVPLLGLFVALVGYVAHAALHVDDHHEHLVVEQVGGVGGQQVGEGLWKKGWGGVGL